MAWWQEPMVIEDVEVEVDFIEHLNMGSYAQCHMSLIVHKLHELGKQFNLLVPQVFCMPSEKK